MVKKISRRKKKSIHRKRSSKKRVSRKRRSKKRSSQKKRISKRRIRKKTQRGGSLYPQHDKLKKEVEDLKKQVSTLVKEAEEKSSLKPWRRRLSTTISSLEDQVTANNVELKRHRKSNLLLWENVRELERSALNLPPISPPTSPTFSWSES